MVYPVDDVIYLLRTTGPKSTCTQIYNSEIVSLVQCCDIVNNVFSTNQRVPVNQITGRASLKKCRVSLPRKQLPLFLFSLLVYPFLVKVELVPITADIL